MQVLVNYPPPNFSTEEIHRALRLLGSDSQAPHNHISRTALHLALVIPKLYNHYDALLSGLRSGECIRVRAATQLFICQATLICLRWF